MISSFVILEIYFFIILIADVLFIYLICIREPKTRKLYRLGLIVHWFGAFFQCVTDDFFMFRLLEKFPQILPLKVTFVSATVVCSFNRHFSVQG